MKLKILPRYGNIIDNFNSSGLDGAFSAASRTCWPMRRLEWRSSRAGSPDNTSTYHGLIFVRKDSQIRTAHHEGKRFAFVDKATTAGTFSVGIFP